MSRYRWILALVLAPGLMATSCIRFRFIEVDVSGGSDAVSPPVFSFTHERAQLTALNEFQVTDCWGTNGRPMWTIVADGVVQHASEPLRITYGRVPLGYREEVPATQLQPGGCYRAVAKGHPTDDAIDEGRETFRVLPTGRLVVGEPDGSILYNSPAFRQLNRAAVGCAGISARFVRGGQRRGGPAGVPRGGPARLLRLALRTLAGRDG